MKNAFRLTLSILIFAGFAGLAAAADSRNDPIDILTFAGQPEELEGRIVEVSAQVIAISADSKSLELFDSQTRTLIRVRLIQLRKADRTNLMRTGVRRIAVTGRASVVGGRLVVDAERIEPLPLETDVHGQLDAVKSGSR
jgi:hypothetical protein